MKSGIFSCKMGFFKIEFCKGVLHIFDNLFYYCLGLNFIRKLLMKYTFGSK